MQAREYQEAAVHAWWNYFVTKSGNPLILLPTGTGKSVVLAMLFKSILQAYHSQRIMLLTHVKELIEQDYKKILDVWPTAPVGVYSAGLGRKDLHAQITVGGVGTVVKNVKSFGHIDLLFVDEAHLISQSDETSYRKIISALMHANPHLKVTGLTATPWRLGQGKITDAGLFTDECFNMTDMASFNWFISEGYLLPLVPKPTEVELLTDGVHRRGGEFIQSELQLAVGTEDLTRKALAEAAQLGGNRWSWLVFTTGVEHAKMAADILNEMGISAAAVHSDLTSTERNKILADWFAGRIRAVTNNNVLTTGVDHPPLDLIVGLRPTESTTLWVQMLGRGTRPCFAPGFDLSTREGRHAAIAASHKQNCMVLDFAGNIKKLGPINDPVIPRKKGEKAGEAPVKLCTACNTWNHASARVCAFCHAEFVFLSKLKQEASTMELIKGTPDLPIIDVVKVDHITYAKHTKVGKPASLRVSYYCGLRMYNEFICLEHIDQAFAIRTARDWWRKRSHMPIPTTIDDALLLADSVKPATHLKVHLNKKPYPEIRDHCLDGTAFNSGEEILETAWPTTSGGGAPAPKKELTAAEMDFDDDIPF